MEPRTRRLVFGTSEKSGYTLYIGTEGVITDGEKTPGAEVWVLEIRPGVYDS